uniref:Uncharacterized protein n=1 Tax=Trichogramma kaykai TaxID=54128 RepID=A0ABD2WCR0_9HYME
MISATDKSPRASGITDDHDDAQRVNHLEEDSLAKLKSMREKVNWKFHSERHALLRQLYPLIKNWKGRLPDLRDIFRPTEIDWLITQDVISYSDAIEPGPLIEFVSSTGYKDKPDYDENGEPLLLRTTPLHHAAASPIQYIVVNELFKIYQRFDANYISWWGSTHFHAACKCGFEDVVEKFLEIGLNPNCREQETGDPPLHLAVARNHKRVAELLLRSGADPNLTDRDGRTALHIFGKTGGDAGFGIFELSDDKYQPISVDTRDNSGKTPLHLALHYGNMKSIEFLLRNGADPNLANDVGFTPLHIICLRKCDDDLMEIFFKVIKDMQQTVEVDARVEEGWTPLYLALLYGHKKVTESLLRNGADPNLANQKGLTSLHIICLLYLDVDFLKLFFKINDDLQQTLHVDAQDKDGHTPLHLALKYNKNQRVIDLLLTRGAHLNLLDQCRMTPLHLISCKNLSVISHYDVPLLSVLEYNSKKKVKWLLKTHADRNSANKNRWTPLHVICIMSNDDDLMKLFFKMTEELKQPVHVDARDNLGRTPLQMAVTNLYPDCVGILLRRGADLSNFVFPTESQFIKEFKFTINELIIALRALKVVERLEKKGYELNLSDALQIMKLFARFESLESSSGLDESWNNVHQRVWPRASAAAERLWSPEAQDDDTAARRLEEHACRMNRRGVPAQPPNGSGYCLLPRDYRV